jgi:hypothetical protein
MKASSPHAPFFRSRPACHHNHGGLNLARHQPWQETGTSHSWTDLGNPSPPPPVWLHRVYPTIPSMTSPHPPSPQRGAAASKPYLHCHKGWSNFPRPLWYQSWPCHGQSRWLRWGRPCGGVRVWEGRVGRVVTGRVTWESPSDRFEESQFWQLAETDAYCLVNRPRFDRIEPVVWCVQDV